MEARRRGPCRRASPGFSSGAYSSEAMYEKVDERLVPTDVNAAMAAIAIRAAISPYSIAVTPASSRIRFVKHARIDFSLRFQHVEIVGESLRKPQPARNRRAKRSSLRDTHSITTRKVYKT